MYTDIYHLPPTARRSFRERFLPILARPLYTLEGTVTAI